MKLRSGKVLHTRHSELPEELENRLEHDLENFKTLFSGNPEHAKELLKMISKAVSQNVRFDIREKIEEVYDLNLIETHSLLYVAGELSRFLVHNPEYHDLIEKRIKDFDLELPLSGNIEDHSMELL